MFEDSKAFSGFSVNDLAAAKEFYGQTLGLTVDEDAMGLTLKIAGDFHHSQLSRYQYRPSS
jgi:extradiol dioxygenase family protein